MGLSYKLIGRNDLDDIAGCIFENRGICDMQKYLNLTDDVLVPYENLNNILKAVEMFRKHIEKNSQIAIIVDCDVDGQCGAAMMYSYIRRLNDNIIVKYYLHSGKQHGLSDDIEIDSDTDLLIIPDAGTNDTKQCEKLKDRGIDVIVLDHHEKECENPYAIVVNNQCSENYTNKDLCGAGIVYKFLQALDDYYWNNYADDYLDLVALANISDIMDIRSFETKRLIDKGLSMITNKCFEAFVEVQNFSMKGKINPHTIAFCITPLINAMCRVGDNEEKDLLFRAFTEQDEDFEYKKRGSTESETESIYKRAVRLCSNAKSRQDRQVNKIVPLITDKIKSSKNRNAVMFIKADEVPSVFSGIVAMKLADKFKKPCLMLRRNQNVYRGSARNFDNSYIENLKDFLVDTDKFNWCQGHQGAFGFEINACNVKSAIDYIDGICKDKNKIAKVDFEVDYSNFNIGIISDVVALNDYYGTGIKEPKFIIKNITLQFNQGSVMGKNEDTWKFINDDNIAIIKFKNPEHDEVLNFLSSDESDRKIVIDAICQVSVSEYKGIITPQITIEEYEVVN